MASPFITLPVPEVPSVPGVPPLPLTLPGVSPFTPSALTALPILVTGDAAGIIAFVNTAQWGIFDDTGTPIIEADAVASIEYGRDYRISDYPQEEGAFASYNKVQLPYEAKVGFLIQETRENFLNEIESLLASLDLISVVTPEVTYASANLTHYNYRRTQRNGVTMILVEVWCEEVRVTAARALSNAQSTNGQPTQQNGAAQAQQPSSATSPAISTTQQFNNTINSQIRQTQGALGPSPSFFAPAMLPSAPQPFAVLPNAQQQAITSLGQKLGMKACFVGEPDPVGSVTANFTTT